MTIKNHMRLHSLSEIINQQKTFADGKQGIALLYMWCGGKHCRVETLSDVILKVMASFLCGECCMYVRKLPLCCISSLRLCKMLDHFIMSSFLAWTTASNHQHYHNIPFQLSHIQSKVPLMVMWVAMHGRCSCIDLCVIYYVGLIHSLITVHACSLLSS